MQGAVPRALWSKFHLSFVRVRIDFQKKASLKPLNSRLPCFDALLEDKKKPSSKSVSDTEKVTTVTLSRMHAEG